MVFYQCWNAILLKIKIILNEYSSFANVCDFIILLLIILLIINILFSFEKRQNMLAQKQIDFFKSNKKYLEKIYIELGDTKEILRYFIYGAKWKYKIVSIYNSLFDNPDGKIFKDNIINRKIKFYINPYIATFLDLKSITSKIYSSFCIVKDRKFNEDVFCKKDDKTYERFYNAGYSYSIKFELINNFLKAMQSNCILIKGSAGNGKTNILCNMVQHIIKLKNPCIFINSRDINKNVKEYIFNQLQVNEFLKIKLSYNLFLILNTILKLKRENLYIVIDAINENDTEIFYTTMNDFIDFIKKYSNIKLLLSCRSEYFEDRYNKLFKNQNEYILTYEINQLHYPKRIKTRLFNNYKKEFCFKGEISKEVFSYLIHSLLLMRIFFEVYRNSDEKIISLNKYKIYAEYIKSLKNNVSNPELFINKLVEKMLEKRKFDEISINDLSISDEEFMTFKKFADENLLISRTIKKYEGTLPETEEEVFYFVFDELRDYCISKFIIKKCLDNKDYEYTLLYNLVNDLIINKDSLLEGILKYSYNYFKETNNFDNCSKILSLLNTRFYGEGYSRKFGLSNEKYAMFDNFGLSMIFENNEQLLDCELDFIQKVINDSDKYALLFFANYLINCDIRKSAHSIEILNKILLNIQDINILQQKIALYLENNEHCNKLIMYLDKIENERKTALLKYIAIIVLSQNENDKLPSLKNKVYNTDIIRNIVNECQCKTLIKNAEQFLKAINVGNS